MRDDRVSKAYSEVLLRLAVIENHKRELAAIPPREELKKMYTFSERHEKRMRLLFARDRRKEILQRAALFSKRAAAAVIIAFAVFFGVMLTAPTVRAAVAEVIIEWFETHTTFRFNKVDEFDKTAEWRPTYLPEGFVESYYEFEYGITDIDFINLNGLRIGFRASPIGDTSIAVDNEHSIFEMISYQNVEYHVFRAISEEYPSHIIWTKDANSFSLSSYIDCDELLKIAVSVEQKK